MRAACVVVMLCSGLAGCLDSLPPESMPDSDPTDQPPPSSGACTDLEGKRFQSATLGECGLGPNGPESCYWHLYFAADDGTRTAWTWSHSDVGESGTVTCAAGVITGIYGGTYDPTTLQIMWQGAAYAPAP